MHILFLSHYFPPEVNAPATRTFEHCRQWVRDGHQVTVVTCAPNCPTGVVFSGYRNAWKSVETIEGIRVVRVWSLVSANEGFLRRILNFVSYMLTAVWQALWIRKVDVVVATSPQFFCGWAGVLVHWLKRTPFVLEIRDIWPESIVTVGAMRRSLAIRILEKLERWMYAAAGHIVTVGDGYRDKLLERGVPEAKITVVPNGVDTNAWQPRPMNADLRRQWNGEGKFVCSYIGTVGLAHGLQVVLKAAKTLKEAGRDEVTFWILGDGAQRAELEAEAKSLDLDNVVFTGLVPKAQVAEALASSDASLVHLKGTELFGTVVPSKIFETMAMNVPIIMGVVGQARNIVLRANAGVPMTPDDPASLLTAIDRIHESPMGYSTGRRYVSQEYDRQILAERMLQCLNEAAGVEGCETPENSAGIGVATSRNAA